MRALLWEVSTSLYAFDIFYISFLLGVTAPYLLYVLTLGVVAVFRFFARQYDRLVEWRWRNYKEEECVCNPIYVRNRPSPGPHHLSWCDKFREPTP